MMLSLMFSTTVTGCKKLLPLIVIGSSNTPREFIFDPFAATQLVPGTVLVGGKPIAVWPSVDSCGHARVTGSIDVIVGGT